MKIDLNKLKNAALYHIFHNDKVYEDCPSHIRISYNTYLNTEYLIKKYERFIEKPFKFKVIKLSNGHYFYGETECDICRKLRINYKNYFYHKRKGNEKDFLESYGYKIERIEEDIK